MTVLDYIMVMKKQL